MKRRPALALLAAPALLIAAGLAWKPRRTPTPTIDGPVPPTALPLLNDERGPFAPARYAGRVWVANFWASWCAPCREEHALWVALVRERPVVLVGLNYRDDPRSADEWLRRLGNPYVVNARDADGGAALAWGAEGVPATFVVDRAGVVRLRHLGPLTREAWSRDIQPLLERLEAEPA